ncbi:restriction endonuclease subunit S [Metapseudomonas otitidis]|uniref:restriction endonuclease subunit S n=1 Tax=Metapseudomonas otitidis TaxID=319939 RepID=UPI0013F61177|nr:restriction endonuclease subunit S [Pseudomonas otitidis]
MSWPVVSLGEIFDIARGGSPRPIDAFITEEPDGVNWVMIGDASSGGKYISSTRKKIRKEGVPKSRMVYSGDFLLTNSMSFGRPYIMRTSGCIHDGWLVLKKKNASVDEEFFYHLLGSDLVYQEFSRRAAGATVKNLNIDLVQKVEVVFPPLGEQKRIAAILDKADALRAKRRKALEQLDALAQAIFIEMFGDPLDGEFRWPTVSLQNLIEKESSICYGVVQPGNDDPDGVPLIRAGDLKDEILSCKGFKRISKEVDEKHARSKIQGDELLLSCVGNVGAVALASKAIKGANIARAVCRIPASSLINRDYLAAYLRSPFSQSYFQAQVRTVAQPTLNIKQITELDVALPPLDAQEKFSRIIGVIKEKRRLLEGNMKTLDALFSSLQHRAFRGEL